MGYTVTIEDEVMAPERERLKYAQYVDLCNDLGELCCTPQEEWRKDWDKLTNSMRQWTNDRWE